MEFKNFIEGVETEFGSGYDASRLLLAEMEGVPASSVATAVTSSDTDAKGQSDGLSQDWGRKFCLNGSAAYVDMNHIEYCLPESFSATDHVAGVHAGFRLLGQAAERVNARMVDGLRVHVLANNSDGRSNCWGSHLNFLMRRSAWESLCHRKLHHLGWLAAYQCSSIIFTGQGKVGAENGRPPVDFQITQRAGDFTSVLAAHQTTYQRPIINLRDEPLTGSRVFAQPDADQLARLHVIFYEHNLQQTALRLKVGVLQIILAVLEAGQVDTALLLDDPVDAVTCWSRDPKLRATARRMDGSEVTALDMQLRFCEHAARFVEDGGCEGVVPGAEETVMLWHDTLRKLQARDWEALARRLDWVLKRQLLEQAMQQQAGLDWTSPELKFLDHAYGSLDPQAGLYLLCERGGLVEQQVDEVQVQRFMTEPPENTRAWARAELLRQARPGEVEQVDWDCVALHLRSRRTGAEFRPTVWLPDPLGFTRREAEHFLDRTRELAMNVALLATSKSAAAPVTLTQNHNGAMTYGTTTSPTRSQHSSSP